MANSTNMQVEFVMATHTPDGEQLAEPGVERIKVDFAQINPETFLKGYSQPDLLRDTKKYINIFIFGFTADYENVMELSVRPYSGESSALEGLECTDFWPTHQDIDYMHAVVIDNRWIYELNALEQIPSPYFYEGCIASSTARGLGGYLGLFYIFPSAEDGSCVDADYCGDTPCYNREEYFEYLATNSLFSELIKRKDCVTGDITTPNNVMDLAYSW